MKKSRASFRRFSELWEHLLVMLIGVTAVICVSAFPHIYASLRHHVTPILLQFQKPKLTHEKIFVIPPFPKHWDDMSRFDHTWSELLPIPQSWENEYWYHYFYGRTNNVIIWGLKLEYPTNVLLGQSIIVKATPFLCQPKTSQAEATLWKSLSTGKVILRFNLSSAVVKPETISIITKDNPARWSVTPQSEDMQKGVVSVEYLKPNGSLDLKASDNVNIYVYRPVLTKWNIIKFSGFSILTLASLFALIRLIWDWRDRKQKQKEEAEKSKKKVKEQSPVI